MIVAGLDMATATGVCYGVPGTKPKFFTRDLGAGKSHDARGWEAMRLALHLTRDLGVEAIGIEAPIKKKIDTRAKNELLMGMQFVVRSWAYGKGVRCRALEIQTINKRFLGYQPNSSDNRKAAILKQCQMYGWAPQTQDEADAGAVWESMCVEMSPAYAAASGTLLRGRA